MREELLHFIWKYKRLQLETLTTSGKEAVSIVDVGTYNTLSGPDFSNAKINIDGQLWAGNVEIHVKSSDWYAHHHESDPQYNNVILHVVWEDDAQVFRANQTVVPTLELQHYVYPEVLAAYRKLFDQRDRSFINCEKNLRHTDALLLQNWLERLFFERLEQKSGLIMELLAHSKNDWESVLFMLLLKNMGSKINGDSFLSIGRALHFPLVRKMHDKVFKLESVLFGLAGFLEDDRIVDAYYLELRKEYRYLAHKHDLEHLGVQRPEFFKLRPSNFPTVRLSQLACLYGTHQNLFSKVIKATSLEEIYSVFTISATTYWDTHFSFGKPTKRHKKKLSMKFIDLLVINTLLPLKFCHARHTATDCHEELIHMISHLKPEENRIITNFKALGVVGQNAMESQSLIQLYNTYCSKNKCLQCAVGASLLRKKV